MPKLIPALLLCLSWAHANEHLRCLTTQSETQLIRHFDGAHIADYESWDLCERARTSATQNIVCAWFTPSMPIGPGGWQEIGWRPMNIQTKTGLGRKAISSFETCLELSKSAAGEIVCTYTGLGFKPTNIQTNLWCGASSQIEYCTIASAYSQGSSTCSYPTGGTGAGAGWVKTTIGNTCDYQGSKLTVEDCGQSVP